MPVINRYRVYCQTEASYVYGWYESPPVTCPNNNGHTITPSATAIVDKINSTGDFDDTGRLLVSAGSYTQFKDQRVSLYSPLLQNYALYNIINSQTYEIFAANGGTVTGDSNGTELEVAITTTVGSYAVIRPTKVCKYRPGYNNVARWNTVFDTPAANLFQFCGLGNIGSDIYFCYNGNDFGVRYSTEGYAEVRTFTVTAAETGSVTATITLNDVPVVVNLTNAGGNTAFTAYQISRGTYSGWLANAVGNKVIFTGQSVGPRAGAYTYATAGASTGSFAQTKAGTALSTTFINRADWNGPSRMVQDFNPLMRNMFSINYTWYGSGNMAFEIYDPLESNYGTVHTIYFANSQTDPSISQPNMYLQQGIASLGSTVARKLHIAGGFAAVEGQYKVNSPLYSVDNSRTIAANTETVILALRNRNSIFGFTNNSEILIRRLAFNAEGNKTVKIRAIRNPTTLSANTTGDYTNWQFINETQSIGLVDKSSLTFTGGSVIATYYVNKAGSIFIDLTDKEIMIFKSDTIIFTAFSTAITDIDAAVTIVEDQ